jgi:gliding motility-associated-like protein
VTIIPNPKFQGKLSPSDGLDCIRNKGGIINGITIPTNCKVFWTGPLVRSGDSTLNPEVGASGLYRVNIRDDNTGCTVKDSVFVNCRPLDPLVIPQFISPNNDNKNDLWVIENLELYPNNKVQIFNRWGNLVFSASPYNYDWNGRQEGNNEILPAATYFYLIETNKKSQEPFQGFLEIQP